MSLRLPEMYLALIALLYPLSAGFAETPPAASVEAPSIIDVSSAFTYPPMGAGKVSAAFAHFINNSDKAYRLVAASSPQFARVELHTHSHDKGIMRMREVEAFILPAGETFRLKPGGDHLMLIDAQQAINPGGTVEVTFTAEREDGAGEPITFTAMVPVKAR